ncbi:ROK family protein [Methylobacterium radiotolerans]|uniref:ROK family protein n=1 Tax=Methylobacterium radiotolerans TaxID=31998 RepID=UPI0038D25018
MDQHGERIIAGLRVDSYNLALRENGGFVGDRARSRAFQDALDEARKDWRRRLGTDPLGTIDSGDRSALDGVLDQPGSPAAELLSVAVENFAHRLTEVVDRFLACPEWHDTELIVVGGGLRESRVGEQAIRRADARLRSAGASTTLRPIRNHPDEAALLGAVHFRAASLPRDRDSILAVDIGGGNIRAGVVLLNRGQSAVFAACVVAMREHWRHREERPARDAVVDRLTVMLHRLAAQAAAAGLRPAPLVVVGCPGEIRADGAIVRGGQNLPGDWEAADFNLPARLRDAVPKIGADEVTVLMHNDAVLQGLSEKPWIGGVRRWGVLTIGTGLGNARFSHEGSGSTAER